MLRMICRSKIHRAKVTQTELYYEGSITIDEKLMQEAEILPGEKVEVLNLNNGQRFETYVIEGEKGTGQVCVNGPAARQAEIGDEVIILSFGLATEEEARKIRPKVVFVDGHNRVKAHP